MGFLPKTPFQRAIQNGRADAVGNLLCCPHRFDKWQAAPMVDLLQERRMAKTTGCIFGGFS
ncbi:hypothetical protein, partial [Mesorhizobium sp.]|uniref:hypothetical protein n=1 Tax=Mesorhizobium sp. TaxID=1871066 RepID=UPI0025E8E529